MTLEILQKDMIQAMKDRDTERKSVLSSVIGAVKNAAIAKQCRDDISESLVDEVLLKEKKTLQEQYHTCPHSRRDLLIEYKHKLEILNEYCPKLLEDLEEIEKELIKVLSEAAVEPLKANKGLVMKTVMPLFKGKADMSAVSKVLTSLLK